MAPTDRRFTGRPTLPLELALGDEQLEYLVRVLAGRSDATGRDLFIRFRNALEEGRRRERQLEELDRRRR